MTHRHTQRETMAKADIAWLRMEQPSNLMMITGVIILAKRLRPDRLRRVLSERFLAYARFRQRAVDLEAVAYWEDAPVDLHWHVQTERLPGEADEAALQRRVGELASTPLDHARPLWQFHLVEEYGGGSALIARIHHCYADGIALVQVLLSLTDLMAKPTRTSGLAEQWLREDGREVARQLAHPVRQSFDQALKVGGQWLRKGLDMYRQPGLAAVLAKDGGSIAAELAHALALPDDSQTSLKGPLGSVKQCAWAEPLDLDEVKAVGHAFGCTVNDVLLASVAGALRAYLQGRGEAVDGLCIRVTVPVNLRPLEHAKKLGNHFGLVFLDLPVGEPVPLARLRSVSATMRQIKSSKQALATYGTLVALGMAPSKVQGALLDFLSRKASAVATNVPGPQQPLYLAGTRVDQLMFWVPQSGQIGLGVSILSYNGKVHFGLIADSARVPDPKAVIDRFRPEFEKLLFLMLMQDWRDSAEVHADAALLSWIEGQQPHA